MIDEFKKEAEAVEDSLTSLLLELDKVAAGTTEWTRPVIVPIDVDAAKGKIKDELRKFAAARNGAFRGILGPLFKQVDQPAGSTGDDE
jgi:hypothetical protein